MQKIYHGLFGYKVFEIHLPISVYKIKDEPTTQMIINSKNVKVEVGDRVFFREIYGDGNGFTGRYMTFHVLDSQTEKESFGVDGKYYTHMKRLDDKVPEAVVKASNVVGVVNVDNG